MTNNSNNGNGIESILQSSGQGNRNQEGTPVQEARKALRKYTAQEIQKIYFNTLKTMGDDLEYASSGHLVTGLFGALVDGVYSLWEPTKIFLDSPIAQEFVNERVGEGKTLQDYFILKEGDSDETIKKLKLIKRIEKNPQNLVDCCAKTGKSPMEVLRSTKDSLTLIEKTYGSFNEYENAKAEEMIALSEMNDKLGELEHMPIGMLITMFVKNKENLPDLDEFGVDPQAIGNIIQDYARDVARFGRAFLHEYSKYNLHAVEKYRKLAQTE